MRRSLPRRSRRQWHKRGRRNNRNTANIQKAKVVASVWGGEFIQFLAALAVLPIGKFSRIS